MHQGSPSSAGATAVVLPAPGGATSSARLLSRSAASRSGRTAWIGSQFIAEMFANLQQ